MFDDQVNRSNPPSNLPTEPADMFAGVDDQVVQSAEKIPDALGAGLLKKKDSTGQSNMSTAPMMAPSLYEVKQPILGKVVMFLVVIIVLAAAGFGGWYGYNKFLLNKTAIDESFSVLPSIPNEPVASEQVLPVEEKLPEASTSSIFATTSSDVTAKMNNDKILFGEAVDSDKDGLDDVREKELGSDPYKADTDADELNDGDEVIIWKTNPLNPDTDNDTYKDGQEVRNGYNPLGSGKLFNIPAGVSTSTATTTVKATTTIKLTPSKPAATVKTKK